MKRNPLPILLLVLVPALLFAQTDTTISFDPAQPDANDAIQVTVSGTWEDACTPTISEVERSGSTFRLELTEPTGGVCAEVLTPWSDTIEVEPLDPGTYSFRAVMITGGDELLAARELTVAGASQPFRVQPAVAPVAGGVTVLISAAGIGSCPGASPCSSPVVRFGGSASPSVEVINGSTIAAVVPAHSAGLVDVEVIAAGETSARTIEDVFLYFQLTEAPGAAFEWILLPVMYDGPGAFGSEWTTLLTIVNEANFAIDPWNRLPLPCPPSPGGCPAQIPANSSIELSAEDGSLGDWPHGYVLYVPETVSDSIEIGLRARDLSRQGETWGTEIPVVHESDLRTDTIVLPSVPLSNEFRRDLRIYAKQEWAGARVAVRLYDSASGDLVWQSVATLRTLGRCVTEPCFLPEPAAMQMSLFDVPEDVPMGVDQVMVELVPLTEGLAYWGFVSVTHKETQTITTISPN